MPYWAPEQVTSGKMLQVPQLLRQIVLQFLSSSPVMLIVNHRDQETTLIFIVTNRFFVEGSEAAFEHV